MLICCRGGDEFAMKKRRRNVLGKRMGLQYIIAVLLLAAFGYWLWAYAVPVEGIREIIEIIIYMVAAAILEALWWSGHVNNYLSEPLKKLRAMCESEGGLPGSEFSDRNDEIGFLADELSRMMSRFDGRVKAACDEAASHADSKARRSMTDEICRSALPQVLPDYPSRAYFDINGMLERGEGRNCEFYDYFYIDPGLLCVVLGETSGSGVAEALYMVVAQTTIRSRLRQGRSLEETMADVNAQMYDLGSKFCLNALVATLGTADGRFTYVNAGQQRPLLMRNEDRYEWLDAPVYAPLGMNENVSYRAMELRLKQGDRLFLHTEGLGKLCGSEGIPYSQQLRADLNLSRSRNMENGELLEFMAECASAYCEKTEENDGFAVLALKFCKGAKDLAHCDVSASPESAFEVTSFIKKQFEDNGIDKRHYALQAVVVDEMFALCCRKAEPDSHIMVECGVAPDAQMVNIRITAMLGGADPMEQEEDVTLKNSVGFIRDHADYVTFKHEEEHDTITIVSFLE